MKDSSVDTEKTHSPNSSTTSDESVESLVLKKISSSDSIKYITPLGTPRTVQSTPYSSTRQWNGSHSVFRTPEHSPQDGLINDLNSPPPVRNLLNFYQKSSRKIRSDQRRGRKGTHFQHWKKLQIFDENESMSCDGDIDESSHSTYDEYPTIRVHSNTWMFSNEWDEEYSSSDRSECPEITPPRILPSSSQSKYSPLPHDVASPMNSSLSTSSSGNGAQENIREGRFFSNINNQSSIPSLRIRARENSMEKEILGSFKTTVPRQICFQDNFKPHSLRDLRDQSPTAFAGKITGVARSYLSQLPPLRRMDVKLKKRHVTKFCIIVIVSAAAFFVALTYKIYHLSLMTVSSHQQMLRNMYSEYIDGVPTDFGGEVGMRTMPAFPSFHESDRIGKVGAKIIVRRSLGGIQVYSPKVRKKSFGEVKRARRGVGALDANMYSIPGHLDQNRGNRPRLIDCFMGEASFTRPRKRRMDVDQTPFSDNTQLYGIRSSDDEALSKMEIIERSEDGECKSEIWQTEYQPSCNSVHEIDLIKTEDSENMGKLELFQSQGYWRNAWRLDMPSRNQPQVLDTMILKTPKYEHNFEHAHYEHDRVDAAAMSQLTFSPHVVDVYSFCGRSVLTEFADGPRLGTLADKAKKHHLKRLEIARDLASGMADVHYGKGDKVQMVHFDINPANIVVVNNTLKINDFNIAKMVKQNTTSGEMCLLSPHHYPNAQWRSPEEVNGDTDLDERADVFSLGHILFRIICSHEPWNKLEVGGRPSSAELADKVKAGKLPRIPRRILDSTDPEIKVIREAMFMCYSVNRDTRASSRHIATFLDNALNRLRTEA